MNSSNRDLNNNSSSSSSSSSRSSQSGLSRRRLQQSNTSLGDNSSQRSSSSQRSTGSSSQRSNNSNSQRSNNSNSQRSSKKEKVPRRSVTPPKSRREFWGQNQSRRRMLNSNSQHSQESHGQQSVTSVGSHDPITVPSSAGTSSMYNLFSSDWTAMVPNDAVKQVIKLMFSSMAVVFQETEIVGSATSSPQLAYTRIPSIPAPAARMLWNELLGGITTTVDPDDGYWNIALENDGNSSSSDPCLSKDVIKQFVTYVNSGKSPVVAKSKTKEKNGFWSKMRRNKNQGPTDDEACQDRQNVKDPFLYFLRDALIQMEFLELAGRRIDDYEEDDNDDDDDEPHDDNDDDLQLSSGSGLNGDDSDVDFAGWDKRKRCIRAQSRTQYFQIYKDMQFQYGIFLSSIPSIEGGFAILSEHNNNSDDFSDTESVAVHEHNTMKRWNDAMSNACWKQLVAAGIIEKRGTSQLKPDAGVAYAIQMYPSHLMRCGRIVETARMLMVPKFFLARLASSGPYDAANQQCANLEELAKRGGDASDAIDPKEIMLASVNGMIKAVKERYPLRDQKIKGEKEAGEVGRALHLVAFFLGEQGHVKLCMDVYGLCLTYKMAALGADHSSVGRTWRHMGHQYMNMYDYDDAIRAYSESVRIERLQDNVQYNHVILALNSMAMIYGMSRRGKKAVDTYSQSLVIQKAHLGESSIQVAETLNSMGIVYGMLCEFDSAIECYSESLNIKIRKLGKDHEDVADVYFNLGLVHKKHGAHESAINDYQEALRIRKDKLGEEHEDVARVLHHIGVVLSDMGEIGDAQRFYEECLRIRRLVLGEDHEDVARTLHNLGIVCYDGGDYDRALECLEDAVDMGRKKVGKRSEKVADSLHSIGLVYQKLANFKEAINNYEDAVKIRRARLGNDHLEVASSLHNLGDVFYMTGELERAMDTYEEAYLIRLKKLGKKHVDVAATRNNMGVVLMKKGEHDEAMACFSAALTIREDNLGPDHEKCSDTLHNMGLVHKNLKEYDEAIGRYEQALRVRRIQLGENDMKVADTLYNMAIVYANTAQYAKALERYKEALRTYRETGMSDDHPSVVNTLQWIKWAQKKMSKASRRDIYA